MQGKVRMPLCNLVNRIWRRPLLMPEQPWAPLHRSDLVSLILQLQDSFSPRLYRPHVGFPTKKNKNKGGDITCSKTIKHTHQAIPDSR